jgi:hypothetical protein
MPWCAHSAPMPCCAVVLRSSFQNGMVGARQGHGMAGVNQMWAHCVNSTGKTQSKPLAARHGRGKKWARHDMCEFPFIRPQ